MVHTVGIFGVNGNVGAATLPYLVKAAEENKIKLVVLHREGNAPKDITAGNNIELRVFSFEDPAEKIEQGVKGINVFISAVGFAALPSEPNLVEALAKSPDLITYFPSVYSTTWEPEDRTAEHLGPALNFFHLGWDRATEKKIGITAVYTGVFDLYFFGAGFTGSPLKENTIWASKQQLEHRFPIVNMDHLGSAIARIAASDPQSIKNKEYSVVTFWPTGNDLVKLYGKLHGEPARVKDFTKADRDEINADAANFGPAKVGYLDRWEKDSWTYGRKGRIVDTEYRGPSIEEHARKFL